VTRQKSTHGLVKDIQQAGGCSHPIRLRGVTFPLLAGHLI
jgi:hypothetical protein